MKLLLIASCIAVNVMAADYNSASNFKWSVSTDGPWKDSMVPASGFKLGASAPTWGNFTDANIQVLQFAKAADNLVHGTVQLNHDYREGTTISPHLHIWFPIAASAATSTNVWLLHYSWGNVTGVFPTSTTVTVTNSGAITQYEHRLIEFPDIVGTSKTVSSIIAVTVQRTGSDGYDVYDDVIGLVGFDVHYRVDTLGSTSEFVK
jgi:hypothetical protein